MRKRKGVSCLFAPAAHFFSEEEARSGGRASRESAKRRAIGRAGSEARGALHTYSLLVPLFFLVLTACDKGPEISPYDYDTREKARIDLPRDASVDVDTDEFILKRKFRWQD